jgi:hypothetical protein
MHEGNLNNLNAIKTKMLADLRKKREVVDASVHNTEESIAHSWKSRPGLYASMGKPFSKEFTMDDKVIITVKVGDEAMRTIIMPPFRQDPVHPESMFSYLQGSVMNERGTKAPYTFLIRLERRKRIEEEGNRNDNPKTSNPKPHDC